MQHAGDEWITVRTSASLPERRLTDADIPTLAKLVSTVKGQPTISTAPGAHHWRLVGLDVSQTGGNTYGIIRCGAADGSARALGGEGFRHLLKDRRFRVVPMYLETPKEDAGDEPWDVVNLRTLRELAR